MTTSDMRTLWDFLHRYFPNAPQYRSRRSAQAYMDILEPFRAPEVMAAATAYVRRGGKFWPDVGDLPAQLTLPAQPGPAGRSEYFLGNYKTLAAVLGVPFPSGIRTVPEAMAWAKQARRAEDGCPA